MTQGEALDRFNRMTYSQLVYYIYHEAFGLSPREIAENRGVGIRTAYKNIESANSCIVCQEAHDEAMAALQVLLSSKRG